MTHLSILQLGLAHGSPSSSTFHCRSLNQSKSQQAPACRSEKTPFSKKGGVLGRRRCPTAARWGSRPGYPRRTTTAPSSPETMDHPHKRKNERRTRSQSMQARLLLQARSTRQLASHGTRAGCEPHAGCQPHQRATQLPARRSDERMRLQTI